MNHVFTPSGRKGKECQLFLPVSYILKVNPKTSDSQVGQDMSMATQTALKYEPAGIREQPATTLEKSKKEADKEKVKTILKLDERDIDDTMNAEVQEEILRKIKQKRSNQHSQGGDISSHNDIPRAADQTFSQQNVKHYIHPGSEHSYWPSLNLSRPYLQAEEMELVEVS